MTSLKSCKRFEDILSIIACLIVSLLVTYISQLPLLFIRRGEKFVED